jgi:hypothetical protein
LAYQAEALIKQPGLIEPIVRFYRNPMSQFESGEAALDLLKQKEISSRIDTWYWVENNNLREWVPEKNLFYLRDFVQHSPMEQTAIIKEKVQVLRFNKGWIPADKIDVGTTLTVTTVRSDWACGWDSLGKVCAPTDKILLAIDAAQKVQDELGRWHSVKVRNGATIVSTQNTELPVSKIKTWEPDANVAFIRPSPRTREPGTIPAPDFKAFSKVAIIKKELRQWHQSLLPNHGNIWWQIPDPEMKISKIILTHDELMSRKIFSQTPLVTNKDAEKLSLISADGIFLSQDGETWSLLDQFAEGNHPVAIGPKGTLVVGDQISLDHGATFQSYLRWDQIAQQSHKVLHHAPKHLRLHNIRASGSSTIEVQIDVGYKLLTFEFNSINNQIKYLRNSLKR